MFRLLIGVITVLAITAIGALIANGFAIYSVKGADGLFIYLFVLALVTAACAPKLVSALGGSSRSYPAAPRPLPRPR